jgi:hypothetical protein
MGDEHLGRQDASTGQDEFLEVDERAPWTATGRFGWQEGYGAFTVSESQIDVVRKYILNQEEHHRKLSFREEFIMLLKRHGIPYDPDDFDPEKG